MATEQQKTFTDLSTNYANYGENWIMFTHVFSGTQIYFKAFITEYQDSFASHWNSEEVYGRNDPIMTFKNTVRTLSFSWTVPAVSIDDAEDNLKRAAQLMRFCYPSYIKHGSASTISKPPLIRVKFRNLIKGPATAGLLVAPSGFSFSPVVDDGFFDPTSESSHGAELIPKTLVFSCEMTVLHEEKIGWDQNASSGKLTWSEDASSFPFLPTDAKFGEIGSLTFALGTAEKDEVNRSVQPPTDLQKESPPPDKPHEGDEADAQSADGTTDPSPQERIDAAKAAKKEEKAKLAQARKDKKALRKEGKGK